MTVTLQSGAEVRGQLGDVRERDFRMLLESGDWREYNFSQVVTVWIAPSVGKVTTDPTGGWGKKKTLIVVIIIVGAVVAAGTIGYYKNAR